jgi:hypothetical protein
MKVVRGPSEPGDLRPPSFWPRIVPAGVMRRPGGVFAAATRTRGPRGRASAGLPALRQKGLDEVWNLDTDHTRGHAIASSRRECACPSEGAPLSERKFLASGPDEMMGISTQKQSSSRVQDAELRVAQARRLAQALGRIWAKNCVQRAIGRDSALPAHGLFRRAVRALSTAGSRAVQRCTSAPTPGHSLSSDYTALTGYPRPVQSGRLRKSALRAGTPLGGQLLAGAVRPLSWPWGPARFAARGSAAMPGSGATGAREDGIFSGRARLA